MNKLLSLAIEHHNLNNRYGFLSCLDYPKEYNRMSDLEALMMNECERLTADNDMSVSGLYTVTNNLASDIVTGNIPETAKTTLYSRDEFIDLLSQSMTRKEAERFKDMLEWMDDKDKKGYIETRFILEFENTRDHNKQYYYDWMDFVIVVE
ncbi:hypothetical protein D3C73_278120 [compost metagenome]